MTKKILITLGAVLAIIALAFGLSLFMTGNSARKYDNLLKCDKPVYELIKNESAYSTAGIRDNKVIFYDENFNELKTITLEKEYTAKLEYIEKRDDSVIFWHSGSLDDTSGIMFLEKSWSDETWNGLVRITKLDGSAYEVHTFR